MDDEGKGGPWIAWCSAFVVLLALNVGAYAATVCQATNMVSGVPTPTAKYPYYDVPINVPESAGIALEVLFAPIYSIDRHVRREYWADKPAAREF